METVKLWGVMIGPMGGGWHLAGSYRTKEGAQAAATELEKTATQPVWVHYLK